MNPQVSISESLVKALEKLPSYVATYVLGFIVVAVTDVTITSLVIGSILLGLLTSPLIALTAFFLAYSGIRVITMIANAIGSGATALAQQMSYVGNVISQFPYPSEQPPLPPSQQ